jgi:hypothetical protein
MMEALEHHLCDVVKMAHAPLASVIRIAAKAALLVVGKYYALSDDCELYRIAIGTSVSFSHFSSYLLRCIVMCPHRKLKWFEQNEDWRADDVKAVSEVVYERWRETYAPPSQQTLPTAAVSSADKGLQKVVLCFRVISERLTFALSDTINLGQFLPRSSRIFP